MPLHHLRDISLYYERSGKGEPLLFVHGLGASTWTWESQVNYFSANFDVWVPDLRGHGQSSKPDGPYSMELFAQDLIQFIQDNMDQAPHIIGLSMGGIVAFEMVKNAPELVKSLVIVNSGPEIQLDSWFYQMLLGQREWYMMWLSMESFARNLAYRLFPETSQSEIRNRFIHHWSKNDKKAYRAAFRAMTDWRGGNNPSVIHCPTLFISTPNDYTPVALKEDYIRRMPRGQLQLIQDSRHITPLDQPDAFNRVLLDFLQEVEVWDWAQKNHALVPDDLAKLDKALLGL